MSTLPRWLHVTALVFFPRAFRRRHGDDLLETLDDLISHAAPAERPRVARRAFLQLVRSGLAERLATWTPRRPTGGQPRSSTMEDVWHDFTHALRSVLRRPGFALMVMLTLAIGLGSSAAMFGVIHGVLLEPLPYAESERLVTLLREFTNDPGREAENMSLPDLRDVQMEVSSLEAIAGYRLALETLRTDGEPQLILAATVTDGILPAFGLAPHLGRDIGPEDARVDAPHVAVLGHDFWRRHYGSDRNVVGQTVTLSGEVHEVVGVAPEDFAFPEEVEVYTALQIDTENDCGRDCHLLNTVGRLAAHNSLSALGLELEGLGAALAVQYPESNSHKRFAARSIKEQQVAPVRGALWTLLGAVQLVVLIAAANVANLILVRGSRRRREMAIRTAVGAGRLRLFRQLVLENSILAAGGAVLGWGVGWAALRGFLALAPADLPRQASIALNGPVLAFTALLTLGMLMLFGLIPAWRAATDSLGVRSHVGERGGRRSRLVLLSAEVALALLLLLASGLLLRSFAVMTEVDLGYNPENLTRLTFRLPDAQYADAELVVSFSEQLEERVLSTPGIQAAGLALSGPFGSAQITSFILPLDRPDPAPGEGLIASFDIVSPGFFKALELEPTQGRFFTGNDTRQAPLALVINQTLADRYFPGKDPVGVRAKIGVSFGFDNSEDTAYTIVGIAPDIRAYSLTAAPAPAVFMAQAQTGITLLSVLARSRPGFDPVPSIKEHLRALDPALPIRSVETQNAAVDEKLGPHRFYLSVLGVFAGIALVLSAVGLYAVIAYIVSQRTRELAMRMALGATSWSVLRLVLTDAMRPALVGVTLGLAGAFAGAQVLESLLYGVTTYDVVTFVAAPVVLLVVAVLATLAPAIRASRLEPRVALGED